MDAKSKQSKRRDDTLSSLNVVIEGLKIAENLSSITPAKVVFSTVNVILTMIRDSMINEDDYVELGLACNTVCAALDRGLKGKQLNELNGSVVEAISQLTTTVADIQSKISERSKQNAISRAFHAKNDSQAIASWRMDLNGILLIFNTELGLNIYVAVSDVRDGVTKAHAAVADTYTVVSEVRSDIADTHAVVANTHTTVADTHAMVSDIRRQMLGGPGAADDQHRLNQASVSGESPPPAPRACFGRGELIEKVVSLAENLLPIALIGPGGIGKTSIARTVLHHNLIKRRFGANRRLIECDKLSASCAHLLGRLSEVIGAGADHPKSLASLRPFLSSGEMLLILDNAESILDPQGKDDAEEIYAVVEELSQFENICLCITSRVSAVPPDCKTLYVPRLPTDAAHDAFHHIYENRERPDLVDHLLDQLDFHPLSITLLATVAHRHGWDIGQLASEWESQRTKILQTKHIGSLAATIDLSIASPMFRELGPDARALLEVAAFFPQGVDKNNIKWLFPTTPNAKSIFDTFCVLSLTHRSDSFITMLAPLRDHFRPEDPKSSPLLRATKEQYFIQLSVDTNANKPEYREARWITSEDVNVEHLLDVFTTIDPNSDSVWEACANFMKHLVWHKKRLTILKPKIEGLPDNHHSKPRCLFQLSRLFHLVGNQVERKRLLTRTLKLEIDQGNCRGVAQTLGQLSDANREMGLYKGAIRQAKEASEILEQLGDTVTQARYLIDLASSLYSDNQLSAAQEAISRAIEFLPVESEQFMVCESHRVLGEIYRSMGEKDKAIRHFEIALKIASPFDWHDQLFLVHYALARLVLDEDMFNEAQAHVERAKSYTSNHTYFLGRAMVLQARVWYEQHRLEEARTEALRAANVYKKLRAVHDLRRCREILRRIEEEMDKPW